MQKFSVYVPAYNEEQAIAPMASEFDRLREVLRGLNIDLDVAFIDDGSSDRTKVRVNEVSQSRPYIRLIAHQTNRGLAGVLETFVQDAQRLVRLPETLGFGLLDGDNSHPAGNFLPMVLRLLSGYDVVIASRFQTGSIVRGVPANRQLYSIVMSWLFRLFGRIPNVRDYSCGFRVYSPEIMFRLGQVRLKHRSFACMVELLVRCHLVGASCSEVPFCLRYDRKESESKMRVVKTIKETCRVLINKRQYVLKIQ